MTITLYTRDENGDDCDRYEQRDNTGATADEVVARMIEDYVPEGHIVYLVEVS